MSDAAGLEVGLAASVGVASDDVYGGSVAV